MTLVAVLAASLASPLVAPLAGQDVDGVRRPTDSWLWAAAGAAVPLGQAGSDRRVGPLAMLALDHGMVPWAAVRLELSWDAQRFAQAAGGLVGGDLQQGRALVAARVAPPVMIARVAPYALAGFGVVRQSERHTLRDVGEPVPGAAFQQTASSTMAVTLLGAGVRTAGPRLRWFAETRWTRAAATRAPTTDVGFIAGLALPLPR